GSPRRCFARGGGAYSLRHSRGDRVEERGAAAGSRSGAASRRGGRLRRGDRGFYAGSFRRPGGTETAQRCAGGREEGASADRVAAGGFPDGVFRDGPRRN